MVSWTAPGSGGSAITSYTVTPYIGSAAQSPVTVSGSPPATTATVTGLTNGTSYTFTVSAANAVGTGPASSPSNAVTPAVPPAVTGVTPGSGAMGVAVSVAPSATFSQPVQPGTVSFTVVDSGGNSVAGSVGFSGGNTVATFTPNSSLAASTTYTATVSGAQNASGTPMSGPYSWSFTTAGPPCPCSIWQDGTPTGRGRRGRYQRGDAGRAVPGGQQRVYRRGPVLQGGQLAPARIPAACGPPRGRCWRPARSAMRPPAGGRSWTSPAPVAVTAGTTYVASYFTSAGHYAATQNGLASAVTNGPLTALAGGGVYAYGSVEHLPHQHLPGIQLLGRRGVFAVGGRHAAGGDEGDAWFGGDG